MAFTGHRRQGYCVLTITTSPTGEVTETLGKGKLTSHVINFNGTKSDSSTPLFAGDEKELDERTAEGTVQIVLSQLELEDEAALGGHTYTAESGMDEKDSDVAPYVRYAAVGTGRKKNDSTGKTETYYRLVKYYKAQFGPADDVFKTKEASASYETHSLAGACYYNKDGIMRNKTDFATFAEAETEMKKFLNINAGV